jgi:hypothetical protein
MRGNWNHRNIISLNMKAINRRDIRDSLGKSEKIGLVLFFMKFSEYFFWIRQFVSLKPVLIKNCCRFEESPQIHDSYICNLLCSYSFYFPFNTNIKVFNHSHLLVSKDFHYKILQSL